MLIICDLARCAPGEKLLGSVPLVQDLLRVSFEDLSWRNQ